MDERFNLGELTVDSLPEELANAELGGITDPIGQIASWFWENIRPAIDYVREFLWGKLMTIRDSYIKPIWETVRNVGSIVWNTISPYISPILDTVRWIWDRVKTLPTNLGDLLGYIVKRMPEIMTDLSAIGSAIYDLALRVREIPSKIIDMARDITSRISDFAKTIAKTLASWGKTITDAISTLNKSLRSSLKTVGEQLTALAKTLKEGWEYWGGRITEGFKTAYDYLKGIAETMKDYSTQFIAMLKDLGSKTLEGLSKAGEYLKTIGQDLGAFFTQAINQLESLGKTLWNALKDLKEWITKAFKAVTAPFAQMFEDIVSFFKKLPELFHDLWAWIEGAFEKMKAGLEAWWNHAVTWWGERLHAITVGMGEVKMTLAGFVNPLLGIRTELEKWTTPIGVMSKGIETLASTLTPEKMPETASSMLDAISKWGKEVFVPEVQKSIHSLSQTLIKAGRDIFNFLLDAIKTFYLGMWATSKDVRTWGREMVDVASGTLKDFFNWAVFKPLSTLPLRLAEQAKPYILSGKSGEEASWFYLFTTIFESMATAYVLSNIFRAIGRNLNFSISLEPLGIGGTKPLELGAILMHLGGMLFRIPDTILASIGYGMGIWLTQPWFRLINAQSRNLLPIELPTLSDIREITNRFSQTDKFQRIYDDMRSFLSLYGYSDYAIVLNLGAVVGGKELRTAKWLTPAGETVTFPLFTTIKDRFDKPVRIPLALRYKLPSPSDLSRMMIHDIIIEPDQFITAMGIAGMAPDVSRLYFLLHFRYPTLENLWNFICRVSAGFGWVTKKPETITIAGEPTGKATGISPADLSKTYAGNPIEGVKTLTKQILPYVKWWDYAPFAWIDGFTSDQAVMMDLMADIPTRIDARWMYKWGVIDEEGLMRIVVARGTHPNFVEDVTVGEAMNALMDERTYARTGILNVFERGYLTYPKADDILKNLTSIRMLGKDRTVKFLEGERKLLLLRSIYDRAYRAIDAGWDQLVRGYYENVWDKRKVMEGLKEVVKEVNEALKLNLSVDEPFIQSWLKGYDYRREYEVVERIRRWMWTFVYRVGDLAQAGRKVDDLINDYVEDASLTDKEKELIKEFIELFRDTYITEIKTSAILGKLRRGEITRQEAEQQLKEIIEYPELIDALIERDLREIAREYTLSLSSLLSYATIIAIPEEFVKKRLEALRVPREDAEIIMQVFKVKPIKDELALTARRVLDAFEDGMMTEEQARTSLAELLKKPYEIDLLISASKFEKEVRKAKLLRDAIINKLRRGAITVNQAKQELLKIIKDEAYVDALLEAKARIRTVSTDKLVSMMEYIPVDLRKLKEKMDAEGVPPDEQALYLPYSVGREISEEVGKLATELVSDYVDGIITETQLKAGLDDLATLGGKVKDWLGVEWLVLSPLERDILISLAKMRRARKLAKARRS